MSASVAKEVQRKINDYLAGKPFVVVFTNHFFDRLAGREESVAPTELFNTFVKFFDKFEKTLESIAPRSPGEEEAILLKDFAAQLNIPLEVKIDKSSGNVVKWSVIGVTIMRKPPAKFVPNQSGEKQFKLY
jgi:hypothetical protein